MKGKKIIIALILLMLFGLMIVRIFSKIRTQQTQGTQQTQVTQYWTCAMHPSVRADKPGKCPICGMDLIPVEMQAQAGPGKQAEEIAKQEDYYGCGIKEFGNCPHCDEGKPDTRCI